MNYEIKKSLVFIILNNYILDLVLFRGLWTNYYQDLSKRNAILLGVILPSLLLAISGKGLLKSIAKTDYFKASIICASYFTFILMFYDFIYLKLFLAKSFHYLIDYWYLTIFSPIAFLILLPIGYKLDKLAKKTVQ